MNQQSDFPQTER